jgi:glycosyltransferase involved in cell wall biosynthesis
MPREPFNVVVAAPPMNVGGTERHLLHVLPALEARGFRITAVLLDAGGALEDALRAGITAVRTPKRRLPRPLRTFAQARLLREAARNADAVLVHAFLSEPYIAAALARFLSGGGPALVYGRRSLAFYMKRQRLGQRAEIGAHRFATALVGNSAAVTAELVAEAGGPEKVCLIRNGVPLGREIAREERASARAKFGLPSDALVMALVANLHVYKGHADLIEALARVKDRLPVPWRVLLVGRDGGERARLVAQVAAAGLQENVLMPGEWPGSREPYAAADIGLLVSHTEGFSNSLIEGMAAGLPMIATTVGGNVEAIDDRKTGLLVEPRSPQALGEAILGLAHAPELRRRLGGAARQAALQRFSLEACVDAYEQLWRGIADGRGGPPSTWLEPGGPSALAVEPGRMRP